MKIAPRLGWIALALAGAMLAGCRSREVARLEAPPERPEGERAVAEELPATAPLPGERLPRRGDEILVCGQLFHTGTKVVLWTDPYGYDAYRVDLRFPAETGKRAEPPQGARYATLRKHLSAEQKARVEERGWELLELQQEVQQFVMHYDVCGTSRQCFKVLHDIRGLSVHFLLDVDGTLYQTLDLKERGWHAGEANDRSIGVEIAHIGAYESQDAPEFARFYAHDAQGVRLVFPPSLAKGAPAPEQLLRPARNGELIAGEIHGRTLYQYDFTDAQYEALAHLVAALRTALPKIELEAPRDAAGRVRRDALSAEELARFSGLLGHFHVTRGKADPGPAFDWERVLARARELSPPQP
ncbi:MAG: N-acetylmuramoyl-L-alanine amidase [Planctomycetes bacterium]|nr:N-acetylmuramoyl-L-alanine amidase [Planctomycetota bacterium]